MVKTVRILVLVGGLSLLSAGLWAQSGTLDLSGEWDLETVAQLPQGVGGGGGGSCTFEGNADVLQDGTALGGDVAMTLVDGDQACPPEMDAALSGEVMGDQVEMGMLISQDLGEAEFTGGVAQNASLQGGTTLAGTMSVTAGPFLGTTGTWTGVQGTLPVTEIPTLSAIGLTLLVVVLLLAGGWFLRRRSPAPAS